MPWFTWESYFVGFDDDVFASLVQHDWSFCDRPYSSIKVIFSGIRHNESFDVWKTSQHNRRWCHCEFAPFNQQMLSTPLKTKQCFNGIHRVSVGVVEQHFSMKLYRFHWTSSKRGGRHCICWLLIEHDSDQVRMKCWPESSCSTTVSCSSTQCQRTKRQTKERTAAVLRNQFESHFPYFRDGEISKAAVIKGKPGPLGAAAENVEGDSLSSFGGVRRRKLRRGTGTDKSEIRGSLRDNL